MMLHLQAKQWATPCAAEAIDRHQSAKALQMGFKECLCGQAKQWATPQSRDEKNPRTKMMSDGGWNRENNLGDMVPHWPTPKSRDIKGQSQRGEAAPMDALPNAVFLFSHPAQERPQPGRKSSPNAPTSPRRLNPAFVELLMGWCIGWTRTDCALPETELSRWRRLTHLSLCTLLYRPKTPTQPKT
jgi:hypothetical protein